MDADVFKTSSGYDVLRQSKTSSRRLGKNFEFTTSYNRSNLRRLVDVQFTTSWRHLIYDVLRTSGLWRPGDTWFTFSWRRPICHALKTSDLRRFQDFQFTTSWRRLIYILKTSVKRRLCGNFIATYIHRRKKLFILILYCLKYSENFEFSSLG